MNPKQKSSTRCALCSHPIDETGIMAANPKTGKTSIMHLLCWKKEMDKARQKFLNENNNEV